MSNATYIDNKNGTIIKITDNGGKYAYDFLVGRNIPKGELITDYCYNQFDENLKNTLNDDNNKFPTDSLGSFCSGTCVAMILAISRGDNSIKPEDVALWDNSKGENGKSKQNWIPGVGLRDWEQEEDILNDGGQIYDNRDNNCDAIDGSRITTEEEYLNSIKIYLSAGLPVIIDVDGHFVVVVGVESNVKLEEATFKDFVIFDPGQSDENQIVTLGESVKKYNHASYRLLTPFPVIKNSELNNNEYYPDICYSDPLDDKWSFVADENGEKTHDPYYLAPVRKSDESIIPAKQGRTLKKAIEAVNNSTMTEDEKAEKIEGLKELFTESVSQLPADIIESIKKLPLHGKLELADGYRVEFAVDDKNSVHTASKQCCSLTSYTDPNGKRRYYPYELYTNLFMYAKFYKGEKFLFAMRYRADMYNTLISRSTWYTYNDSNVCTGVTVYHSYDYHTENIKNFSCRLCLSSPSDNPFIEASFQFDRAWNRYNPDGSTYPGSSSLQTDMSSNTCTFGIGLTDNYSATFTALTDSEMFEALIDLRIACAHAKGLEFNADKFDGRLSPDNSDSNGNC